MSAKNILLGVLMDRPLHGYKLKSHAYQEAFSGLGIKDGQLYPTLNKMEEDGLIQKKIERQEGAPSRHVYHITAKGRKEFYAWLTSSEGEDKSFKYDFVRKDIFYLKCKFINHLDKKTAVGKINNQIALVKETLEFLKKFKDDLVERNVDPLRIKFMEYIAKQQNARLEWLNELLEESLKYKKFQRS